jgi:transposase
LTDSEFSEQSCQTYKKTSAKSSVNKATKTCRTYDDTFKQQALQLIWLGQSVPTEAQALGLGEGLLYKWKQAQRPATQAQEPEQLRARLKQVETERDILKKDLRTFSRQT